MQNCKKGAYNRRLRSGGLAVRDSEIQRTDGFASVSRADRPVRTRHRVPRMADPASRTVSMPFENGSRPSHRALGQGWPRDTIRAMERIAPIFPVHDLDAAMGHYQRLGFTVRAYRGGGYGFAF